MIDTGCRRSLDVIKYRLSLLEAQSYRINCGIYYCTILGKQILYFEEETDIYKKKALAIGCRKVSTPNAGTPGRSGVSEEPCFILLFCLS